MQKSFWNERYNDKEFIYGEAPNEFLVQQLELLKSGKGLFVAEGEGRNAVYAATKGWEVEAFDYAEAGQRKANQLASANEVSIDYHLASYDNFDPKHAPFDVVALIYNHTDSQTRSAFNQRLISYLKPGGMIIMEQFSTKQLGRDSGGPKDPDMLMDIATVEKEFHQFEIILLQEKEINLQEGKYHEGEAVVIRMVAKQR